MNHIIQITLLFVIGCSLAYGMFFSQIVAELIEPVNVSQSEGKSDLAQLAVFDDNVYIVWRDNSTGDTDIYFSNSSYGELNFNEPVNISNNTGASAFPRIQIEGESIFVTWYDYTLGQSDILFAKSFDNGKSFETINLSNNEGVSYNPWVASYKNNVYVVWNDETPNLKKLNISKPKNTDITLGTLDILLAKSHDGGSTFEIINLSDSIEFSLNPRIVVNQNYVYVVWHEKTETGYEIFFAVSNDSGQSFSQPINISKTETDSNDAAIEVFENNVYVLWKEGASDIFFAKSENNGISFTDPIKISNTAVEITRDTQMVAYENFVYVVSFNKSPEGGGAFFVRSDDYGNSFSEPINLSGKFPNVAMAQIAANQENLYVIWQDNRLGNSEIFLRKSNDNGQSFGSIINISNDKADSNLFILGPQIATIDNNFYTIYEKVDESGSDLFLDDASQAPPIINGTYILNTIDREINVEIKFDKETIDINQPTSIVLKFLNATNNQHLNKVNYSLSISDTLGNNMLNRSNLFAELGVDNQTLSFDKKGPFIITVSLEETGDNFFNGTNYSTYTDTIITVVPEFPVGIFIVIIVGLGLACILSRTHGLISNKAKS